jgi:hypothetical protein
MPHTPATAADIPRFDRRFFDGSEHFTRIGDGACGGKASGPLVSRNILAERFPPGAFRCFTMAIPTPSVITTQMFDEFMAGTHVEEIAFPDAPDHKIAHAFQRAELPVELLGDLRALVQQVHTPLAVRSSSLLEDALYQPFVGVYVTKMIPNNQFDRDTRFRKLIDAVTFVYASTFFRNVKDYAGDAAVRGARLDAGRDAVHLLGGEHGQAARRRRDARSRRLDLRRAVRPDGHRHAPTRGVARDVRAAARAERYPAQRARAGCARRERGGAGREGRSGVHPDARTRPRRAGALRVPAGAADGGFPPGTEGSDGRAGIRRRDRGVRHREGHSRRGRQLRRGVRHTRGVRARTIRGGSGTACCARALRRASEQSP